MMNKILAALVALAALIVVSCVSQTTERDELTVSIPAQKWLLDSIVGDRYKVVAMLEDGSNPETFEPTMQQLMSLQNSAAYFTVGNLGFELASMPKIKENFPTLEVIDTSKGIIPIEGTHTGHACASGQNPATSSDNPDPHLWTSLSNARILARNMYETLVRMDPDGKDYYSARFKALDSGLSALNDSIAGILSPLKDKAFLVWHPSLSYFARDYSLKQISVEISGKEASPAQYRAQLDLAKKAEPLLFFTQTEFDPRQAQAIAEELNIPAAPIAVMQFDISAQIRSIANELSKAASLNH